MAEARRRRKKKQQSEYFFDYSLLFIVLFLLGFGLIMIYSASSYEAYDTYGDAAFYMKKQLVANIIGLVGMIIIANIPYHFWERFAMLGYVVSMILIFLVKTPLGISSHGATRWIGIPHTGFNLQPAEVAKLCMILFLDKGFQTLQALYAIGSGGIWGKGLGQSMQKLSFLPEAQNDMIFSIICEELGLFGAVAIILMFIMLLWRMMVIANNAPDLFGAMLVVGVMGHIAIQAILNIAVVTNSIPNTGISLPFISYGGSSALFLLAEIGLVLSVARRIQLKEL